MRWKHSLSISAAVHLALAAASRLTPPVLPLIVRTPYLSTWLGDARNPPWSQWPMFYEGQGVCLHVHMPRASTERLCCVSLLFFSVTLRIGLLSLPIPADWTLSSRLRPRHRKCPSALGQAPRLLGPCFSRVCLSDSLCTPCF